MSGKSLATLLEEGRREIQVTDEELAEAKRRRGLLAKALRRAFPGAKTYFNGSVAHGDANSPLTDVDLGAVLSRADAAGYGPDGHDALSLMERARDVIREDLEDEFHRLTVEVAGRRRAVLVRFGDPVTKQQEDFTADVMTAVPHPSGKGLYIPNMEIAAKWDHADPVAHTEMVLRAIESTDVVFARAVRLLKHWNCKHSKPLCSWNIKALALDCIETPMPLIEALQVFFTHAAEQLEAGPTPDPAGVAGDIPLGMPINEVRKRLRTARDYVDRAIEHQVEGRPLSAQHALHQVLPEIVPDADATEEEAARLRRLATSGTALASLGLAIPRPTQTRAWAA
ncbi:hypothetical protein [Streptomyces sp. WMMC940]|uniref:hypothetical protein n=1 Tax=Streptomyces sp. WMMC940 TaxID=3015153 RepID=UPI0022B73C3F|nr:hypothetical protein [Streptomyces sp. WMMC940]MCZ7459187.1 hypothetical protein [Streptomyces sp. WMMC940]